MLFRSVGYYLINQQNKTCIFSLFFFLLEDQPFAKWLFG